MTLLKALESLETTLSFDGPINILWRGKNKWRGAMSTFFWSGFRYVDAMQSLRDLLAVRSPIQLCRFHSHVLTRNGRCGRAGSSLVEVASQLPPPRPLLLAEGGKCATSCWPPPVAPAPPCWRWPVDVKEPNLSAFWHSGALATNGLMSELTCSPMVGGSSGRYPPGIKSWYSHFSSGIFSVFTSVMR